MAQQLGEVEGEAVGVGELEGSVAGEHTALGELGQVCLEQAHALAQRAAEGLLFGLHHLEDEVAALHELGEGRTHLRHHLVYHLVEEEVVDVELDGKANGPAHDAAHDIVAADVGGHHPVCDGEGRRAGVVGDDAQSRVHVLRRRPCR